MVGSRSVNQIDETIAEALRTWQQGNHDAAINLVRPLADQGEPGGLLLICWFFQQLGEPRAREGIPYAKRAAEQGTPWVTSFYFPMLADKPETRADAIAMIALSPLRGAGTNDPISRAMQFASEGDAMSAAEMLRAAAGPYPWTQPPDLSEIRNRVSQLDHALTTVGERQATVLNAMQAASEEIDAERESFRTRGKTLTELLNNLTNASSQSHFDDQASKYEKESRLLWTLGVIVLTVAAMAAFLPVILNYVDSGHVLHGQSNISAHLGAAVALAAVAGVLLARARNRDGARQRNRDLSVALGTMFAYSEQIDNEEAKERFKHDMGRLVLETFLQHQPATEDGARNLLSDILSRAPQASTPPTHLT
jgi:hypothetical protein